MSDSNQNSTNDQPIEKPTSPIMPLPPEKCPQCDEYLNGWKRALADYDNLKKQLGREREDLSRHLIFNTAEAFLPVVDHLMEAMRFRPAGAGVDSWVSGIGHIQQELLEAFNSLGVKKIEAVGRPFDTKYHDSVGARYEAGEATGTILEERQAGYELNGVVLRPAKVIVAEDQKSE